MHFDDRLSTVLRLPASSRAIARIQFRQLVDLLGRHSADDGSATTLDIALARIDELGSIIPAAERAAILQEPMVRLGNPELVALLAAAEPDVASAAIRAADLSEAQWLAIIPTLPVRARGILRHRQGFSPRIEVLLERLGIGDRGLPPAVTPPAPERPQLVVMQGGAAAAPGRARSEEPSVAGIGAIVQRIEAFRKARATSEKSESDPAQLALAGIGAVALTKALSLDFTTDTQGRVDWADGPLATALVGFPLSTTQAERTAVPLNAAMRHRQPLRDITIALTGAPDLAGSWRLDALPRFGSADGRFLGYSGRLRRPSRQAASADAAMANAADSMREVLHELRTPANAIQVAAEIIQQQLYGPAPHQYRALAAAIAGDTAQILAGFEELDRLVRLESGVLTPNPGECDLGTLVQETVARLRAWTTPRGSGFSLPHPASSSIVALEREEVARLVWRLLAALTGATASGDVIDLALAASEGEVVLIIDAPASLGERLDEARGSSLAMEPARSLSSGIFGIGFTLRLAAAEAAAAGGVLECDGARFRLILPGLTPAAAGHTQA